MKAKLLAACLPLLLVPADLPAQESRNPVPLDAVISAESDLVLLVESVPNLVKNWSEGPLALTWKDPQVMRFFAPLRDEMQVDRWEELTEEATGYTLTDILDSFVGQAAFVLPDLRDVAAAEGGEDRLPRMAVVAEIGQNRETIVGLLTKDLERQQREAAGEVQYREIEEEYEGETLHIRQTLSGESLEEHGGWAIVDTFAVTASQRDYLEELVANLKRQGSPTPLSGTDAYRKMKRRTPESDLLLYLSFHNIPGILVEVLEGEESEEAQPNPLGLQPEAVVTALGLDAVEGVYLSGLSMGGATQIEFGLLADPGAGVSKLLAYLPGPVSLPAFIPDQAVSAGASNFSIPALWDALKEIIRGVNPGLLAFAEMQLQQLSTNAGLDIERGVMESLGTSLVTAEFVGTAEQTGGQPSLETLEKLFAISVTDRQRLEMALEAMKALVGPGQDLFETREYLGTTIHVGGLPQTADPNQPRSSFAYALTETHLLASFGSTAPLETALAMMREPKKTIWSRPEVKDALDALPGGSSAVAVYDMPALIASFFNGLAAAQKMTEGEEAEEEDGMVLCDPEAVPDVRTLEWFFGVAVSAVYKDGDGLFGIFRLPHAGR
jgi:hypothetical protein